MRPQYRARGRPDYGGGGGGRFGGGNFRGSRGRRHMRRPSFDHRPALVSSPHIHAHHERTQHPQPQPFRSPDRNFHPGNQHPHPHHHHHHHHQHRELQQEERQPVPAVAECSHRTESPWQRDRRGVIEVAAEAVVRPESPTPSERHRKRKRKHRSPTSPVLSNISSGSSIYVEEEVEVEMDSDGNASPDYDEVTSEEESVEEEVEEEEEEVEEEIVVVKKKKRKKDKKKKDRERRHRKKEKKRKKEILEERICPPEHEVAAQKEIFSSGQNILVSVSFDDEAVGAGAEADAYKAYRKAKKKKSKRAKLKEERRKQEELEDEFPSSSQKRIRKLDDSIKPVAIIDLERSPGKQVISSPKEVIVLSDEEAGGSGKKKNKSGTEQVGPNTPPEPAPKSPESYDPFDPTKSPMDSLASGVNMGSISTVSYPDHHQHHLHHQHRQRVAKEIASPDLNSADDGILDLHPSSPMDQLTPRQPFRHSPQKALRSTPAKKPSAAVPSGWEDPLDDGDISPYSPRSSDCDDHMFDPPSADGATNSSSQQPKTIALTVDNLRRVFGNDKNTLYGDLRRPNEAVQLVDEMYKPQKVTMEMLDDMPNSAVDLQIKEKLIQKLQRQDRIIEEVKIFLKPHFNKKLINKEEYKTIMKKSVPKICHSRSGEINPVKIQNLIMAYVKKAVAKRKIAGSSSGNAIVSSTTAVT
ncbi:serine/threonine-protein kinase PRP4 homolog [Culex pipiens pallens]|uniref:serine/threonine-protein kinase PRP4 homolog n=1 Tax=Culex pipiens pallens TaxID=42434 RepID=UPI0019532410|nr:serine/threonine-protein kinase PRP4 homolog [Culex pipiens pallens]